MCDPNNFLSNFGSWEVKFWPNFIVLGETGSGPASQESPSEAFELTDIWMTDSIGRISVRDGRKILSNISECNFNFSQVVINQKTNLMITRKVP